MKRTRKVWLKKKPTVDKPTGRVRVVVDAKKTFDDDESAKVCTEALENAGFQLGADVWMLWEVGRVYETRIDCSMMRLAAA